MAVRRFRLRLQRLRIALDRVFRATVGHLVGTGRLIASGGGRTHLQALSLRFALRPLGLRQTGGLGGLLPLLRATHGSPSPEGPL